MPIPALPDTEPAAGKNPRPTGVRHVVVTLATLMAVLLYLDRFCLPIATGYVKEELGLDDTQVAWLLSALFWTYALAQVPAGWLSDRFGARLMLTVYILGWSLFTGLLGLAYSFVALLACRFACGLAQAGAYPTSAGIVSKWVPFRSRGLASGVISTGGRMGGFIAPVLTAYLIVAFVPPATDSALHADDLLDAPGLCRALVREGETPPDRLAAAVRGRLPAGAARVAKEGARQGADLSAGDRAVLLAGLNEVLDGRLVDAVDLDEFAVQGECRRLARLPPDQLGEVQRRRASRLLLEAAYPGQVRKVYGHGWRPVMLVYGAAGFVVAGLFWLLVLDRPSEHPACNAAEVALITHGRPATTAGPYGAVGGLPLGALLGSGSLWLSCASQFFTNFGWTFLLTWLPTYLDEVYRDPVVERGWLASVPILLGMGGMLAGGWVTDALTRRVGPRWGRCLPIALTRFVALGAFLACLGVRSPWAATAAFGVAAIATDLGTPALWAFNQDVGGPYAGSVLGWGKMWGNVGAALSPLVLAWVIGPAHRWDRGFLACAAAFLAAGVVALGIDARRTLVPPGKKG
jgi:MFS family permease